MIWQHILSFKSILYQHILLSINFLRTFRLFLSISFLIRAQVNRLCACFHEGRWFRCRILQISSDFSTATVVYLDWGMMIPMQIGPEHIRRLPNEFYAEPACSIICHLDGVPDKNDLIPSDTVAQCIDLLSENEYDVTVNGYDSTTGGKVVLSVNERIINDQIRQILVPNVSSFNILRESRV
jgi:hypothetical protein